MIAFPICQACLLCGLPISGRSFWEEMQLIIRPRHGEATLAVRLISNSRRHCQISLQLNHNFWGRFFSFWLSKEVQKSFSALFQHGYSTVYSFHSFTLIHAYKRNSKEMWCQKDGIKQRGESSGDLARMHVGSSPTHVLPSQKHWHHVQQLCQQSHMDQVSHSVLSWDHTVNWIHSSTCTC